MKTNLIEIKKRLYEYYKKSPVMFLKFSNNINHLEQIRTGSLYMNNFKYYIDLEEKQGKVGMGDKTEASLVMYDVDITVSPEESNEVTAHAESIIIRETATIHTPLFCMYAVTVDMLEILGINEDKVKCVLKIPKQQLESMKKDFGEHVLIIAAGPFIYKVEKSLTEKKCSYAVGNAIYEDHSTLNTKRFKSHQERNSRLFFYKDNKFAHQKEYRIVVTGKKITEGCPELIGSIEGFSAIRNIESLEDNTVFVDIPINYKKNKA